MERIKRKRLYPLLSAGMLAAGLILSEVMALAQPQPAPPAPPSLQQVPLPPLQPAPSLEKKPAQPAEAEKKKLAPPVGALEKKLIPRLNCGPGWRQVGEMSCEAVKPVLQCPPGTNYFEGKFLVGCR